MTATVVLRVKRGIGVIRLTVPRKTGNNARPAAVGYAHTLAARLTRVLSLTTWDLTLDQVQADGSYSPKTALRAFALVYGPLPGVTVPKNATGGPFDATIVQGMVGRVWNRLSAAQQRAIDQKIGAPHDSASPAVATAASLTFSDKYTALAQHYQSLYLSKVTGAHALTIQAYTSDKALSAKSGGGALATASPRNSSGDWGSGTPTTCVIKVAPETTAKGASWEKLVMAHEAFHCIEYSILPDWQDRGDWIMEGMADWAETEIEPGLAPLDTGSYSEYLQTPGVPLEMRDYDGMGFWHRADEVFGNGSLWRKVQAILLAPNDGAAFAAAGADQTTFLQQWASGLRRDGQGGAPWNQKQPFALGVKSPVQEVGDDANVIAYPFSMQLAHVTRRRGLPARAARAAGRPAARLERPRAATTSGRSPARRGSAPTATANARRARTATSRRTPTPTATSTSRSRPARVSARRPSPTTRWTSSARSRTRTAAVCSGREQRRA